MLFRVTAIPTSMPIPNFRSFVGLLLNKKTCCFPIHNNGNAHLRWVSSKVRQKATRTILDSNRVTFTTWRFASTQPYNKRPDLSHRNKTVLIYLTSMVVLTVGLSFAAVPLYRLYCQATGKGGIAIAEDNIEKVKKMKRVADREITVHFSADTASSLQWNFKPQQISIKLVPGETALAFYSARNPTNFPVDGIATYNVIPYEAAQYFNKIQCFCFEEQRLNPHEEVDMPVFFFIDPEFMEDPRMETVDDITLSYTFFEAKEGMSLPFPVIKK